MPLRFPYLPVSAAPGTPSLLMPMLPLRLGLKDGEPLPARGLLDSGATVNVLPYDVGLRLGAVWEDQPARARVAEVAP